MKKSTKNQKNKQGNAVSIEKAQALKFDRGAVITIASGLFLAGIFGAAGYLAVRFGMDKSLLDELWRFKVVFAIISVATLAWRVYARKLEGALAFLLRLCTFVALYIISAHFLLSYYPKNLWLIDLIVPTALGLLVSQIIFSYKFAFLSAFTIAISFGTIYLATFDLRLCVVLSIPVAIGILSSVLVLFASQFLIKHQQEP